MASTLVPAPEIAVPGAAGSIARTVRLCEPSSTNSRILVASATSRGRFCAVETAVGATSTEPVVLSIAAAYTTVDSAHAKTTVLPSSARSPAIWSPVVANLGSSSTLTAR